jgi:hypothetical protein
MTVCENCGLQFLYFSSSIPIYGDYSCYTICVPDEIPILVVMLVSSSDACRINVTSG